MESDVTHHLGRADALKATLGPQTTEDVLEGQLVPPDLGLGDVARYVLEEGVTPVHYLLAVPPLALQHQLLLAVVVLSLERLHRVRV